MKKMTVLTVVLALAVLLTACGGEKAPAETTAAAESAAVNTVPVETTAPQPLTLTSWSMHATTWSSPNGATIHISATPNYYGKVRKPLSWFVWRAMTLPTFPVSGTAPTILLLPI